MVKRKNKRGSYHIEEKDNVLLKKKKKHISNEESMKKE